MLPKTFTAGPLAASNAALIAASQTPSGSTALTLTGTQPDLARRILLSYGNEASGRTLTVTGTNAFGNVISETLTVPSGGVGTVATNQDFLTVTKLVPAGGTPWTAAVTVGTNATGSTPWNVVNIFQPDADIDIHCVVSGTVTYNVEYTVDDPNNAQGNSNVPPNAISVAGMNGLTATADGVINYPVFAWRVTITAGTGSVQTVGLQAGIRP
jgi:hypothetical protein